MFVRMRRTFTFDQENGTRRTIPVGWSGNLDDAIAQKAVDGGFTSEPESKTPASLTGSVVEDPFGRQDQDQQPARQQQRQTKADDSMSRSDLEQLARTRGIDPDQHRTKSDLVAAINR